MAKNIHVMVLRPNSQPVLETIPNDLKGCQALVGGYIECVTLERRMVLVCNEMGKLTGLPPNRFMGAHGGVDLICGTFFVCASDEEGEFVSIPTEKVPEYQQRFAL